MSAADILQHAITSSGQPVKAVARDINYSSDAIYAATKGIRPIPTQARSKLAKLNFFGCMAVAAEATGILTLFGLMKIDRHIQSLLQYVFKEDKEADDAINRLPQILLNKNSRVELSDTDVDFLLEAGKEVCDRINADFNLIAELDAKYELRIMQHIEKTACAGTQTALRETKINYLP